jgi:hypothetical protein
MILNDQLQRPISDPPFVAAKKVFVITEFSTRTSGSKTGNVIMKQPSGPLPFSLFQRIDDLPMGFLYSHQVDFSFGEPQLDTYFEGQRVPCSKQNTIRSTFYNHAVKAHVVERIGCNILFAGRS